MPLARVAEQVGKEGIIIKRAEGVPQLHVAVAAGKSRLGYLALGGLLMLAGWLLQRSAPLIRP